MKSLSTTILAGAVLSHCVATLQAFGPPSPATTYTFSTWSTRQEEPASFSFSLAMSLLEEDRENSLVRTDLLGGGSNATTLTAASASFGQVVPLKRPSTTTTTETNEYLIPSSSLPVVTDSLQQESRQRNLAVAVTSILLAISSYLWQFTHPITPVQLLFGMQQNSQPISVIGNNQKPTVVDFWAPVRGWYYCICFLNCVWTMGMANEHDAKWVHFFVNGVHVSYGHYLSFFPNEQHFVETQQSKLLQFS